MKQFRIAYLFFFFVCFSRSLMALDATQIDRYKQRLNDPNPKERLAAMDELGSLLEKSSTNVSKETIAIAVNALRDPDSKVRYNAVSTLAVLGMKTAPAIVPLKPGVFDLRSYPPLQAALEKAMSDEYTETRQNALRAYNLIFKSSPEFLQKLMVRFEKEDKSNRTLIASSLVMDGSFSKPVTELLLWLLDDPEYDWFVANDLANMGHNRGKENGALPVIFLPKLAEKLAKATDIPHKEACARAIAEYGAQALPYLDQIQKMRDNETDESAKFNLEKAIEAIKAPAPSPIQPK